jgi:hypothetical protein
MMRFNFTDTAKEAAMRGFFKGFAAPLMLFGSFDSRHAIASIPAVAPVVPASHGGGLAGDWARIGLDMQAVLQAHEQVARAA